MKLIALIFASCLLVPLHAATVVADPFPPAHFDSLYIEKSEGTTDIVIQLAGDAVTYTKTVSGKVVETTTVHPGGDDWFNFIQGLNNAKVYKWVSSYSYPGQGISWVIEFTMEGRVFNSSGTNDYPLEGSEEKPQADPHAGPSVPFQFMWQAALELAGKAAPQKGQAGG